MSRNNLQVYFIFPPAIWIATIELYRDFGIAIIWLVSFHPPAGPGNCQIQPLKQMCVHLVYPTGRTARTVARFIYE